jgi:hypothetical protein
MSDKITTPEMEIALASHFNYLQNLIVPNVGYGLWLHECDLLILTKARYIWEVEIKVSKADLIKDKEKEHGHYSGKIKYLYFAIPDYLLKYQEHIPERAGIITVERKSYWRDGSTYLRCERVRRPKANGKYKFTEEERYKVARLGAIRIWDLKRKIIAIP